MAILNDIYDEAEAYSAQYAMDPNSVIGLNNSITLTTIRDITPYWITKLELNNSFPYSSNGVFKTSQFPINIYSSKFELIRSISNNNGIDLGVNDLPEERPLMSYPIINTIHLKK